jgi:Ca-activated chloride channel family protein
LRIFLFGEKVMKKHSKKLRNILIGSILIINLILAGCSEAPKMSDTSKSDSNSNAADASDTEGSPIQANKVTDGDVPIPSSTPMGKKEDSKESAGNSERYAKLTENPFLETSRAPLSTFSVDVDTASYANARRFLNNGQLPPKEAIRIEEFINYFEYDYLQPIGNIPFSVNTEVSRAPWKSNHKIVRIGLQGKKIRTENIPPSNIVFLLDVSGSMNAPDKLPLLKQALRILLNQLSTRDRIAIVAYAGASGLVLPSTYASDREKILTAMDRLRAGGSTNGGQGIQLAYKIAEDNFISNGNNRVIIATDGDFNVGVASDDELVKLIEQKRESNVYLSVFGFGSGNLNDQMMEKLSNKGNGNYAYIDSVDEAKKALGNQLAGTLFTIAKDVKIQVEFNPEKVAGYRLIGYENRKLADTDFNDDKKDAGEIGSGHSVTALYELVPKGQKVENPGVDELKYARQENSDTKFDNELMTVKLRYKLPKESKSKLLTIGVLDRDRMIEQSSKNMKFATAVAQFGLLLRDSKYKGDASFTNVLSLAGSAVGSDLRGYRSEFISLVNKAQRLKN